VAQDTIEKYFPRIAYETKHDVVVVSSTRYTVKTPQFQAFGRKLAKKINATGVVSDLKLAGVSPTGHAAVLSLLIHNDTDPKVVEPVIAAANRNGFAVAMTGDKTAGYDFGKQSQKDLEGGELGIGLPIALLVLLAVFGAVVAGLIPLLMAILSIIVAL